jgi:tetratricopeptide (TPR) repeat protein
VALRAGLAARHRGGYGVRADRAVQDAVSAPCEGAAPDPWELAPAEEHFARALEIQRRLGNRSSEAQTLTNLGILYFTRGDFEESERVAGEALALARSIDHKRVMGGALTTIGAVQQMQGRLDEAATTYAAVAAMAHAAGEQATELDAIVNTAEVLRWRGALPESRQRYEEGIAMARKLGRKKTLAYAIAGLAELELVEGKLAAARARYGEALASYQEFGDRLGTADSRLAVAAVGLAEGNAPAAIAAARTVAAEFRAQQVKEREAAAMELLARALLGAGKSAEAEQAIVTAANLAAKTSDVNLRLTVEITHARVIGGAAGAAMLRRAAAEARAKQLALPALEARVALAELTGDRTASAAVSRDARARGYMLIANRAATAI